MFHKLEVRLALIALAVLLLVGGVVALACSKESVSPGDVTVTSSVDAGHTHQVTIKGSDVESPPAADKTVNATYSGGHRHTITLTPQDYESIKDGGEVTVTSSSNAGHAHTFVIKK